MTSAHDGAGKTVAIEVLYPDKCFTALNGTSLYGKTSARWSGISEAAKPEWKVNRSSLLIQYICYMATQTYYLDCRHLPSGDDL